jgi:hypothetical protein
MKTTTLFLCLLLAACGGSTEPTPEEIEAATQCIRHSTIVTCPN